MNLERERELFLDWLYVNTSYEHIYIRGEREDNGVFNSDIIQSLWQSWIASASREGYKLVPVEPTAEMINAGIRRQWDELSSPMECMHTLIYKAMLGEVDENN